jgi:hypothetical protein
MTYREAILALTDPEPEIWAKDMPARTSDSGVQSWDEWNKRRIEAINLGARLRENPDA